MNDFLNAIKQDLLDRRMLPLLALAGVALVAAVGYAVLGGSSSSSTPSGPAPQAIAGAAGIAVSEASDTSTEAIAQTTSGTAYQRGGGARNPFAPLPGTATALVASAPSTPKSAPSSTSTSAGSGSSSSSGSGTSPQSGSSKGESVAPAPSQPKKKIVIRYAVTAQFGVVSPAQPGAAGSAASLKTYQNMKLNEPLPAANPQVVYLGVVLRTGRQVVFGLTGEVILHGSAACVPNPTHCQAIELEPGQSEILESFDPSGNPVTYELKLVSIKRSVTTTTASSASAGAVKHGLLMLHHAGLDGPPGLRYSAAFGALVPAGPLHGG